MTPIKILNTVSKSFLFSGFGNLFASFRKEDILLLLPSSARMPIEFVRDFVPYFILLVTF